MPASIEGSRAGASRTRSGTPTLADLLTGMPRVSRRDWRRMGWLRRYLLTVRAAVLALTLSACVFGGLLALPWTPAETWRFTVTTVALLLAHAVSNLLNDQVDWVTGLDREGYFRLRYGTHPLAERLMHPLAHALMLAVTGLAAAAMALFVCRMAGTPAYWLAGIGSLLMIFYTWPLKRLGLGELAVFLVWGPLIVGGVYWVVSGDWGPDIAVWSAVFGIGPTIVVLGKHLDKHRDDAARGVRTLPVLLGVNRSAWLMAGLAAAQVGGGLFWAVMTGRWAYLLLAAALPATLSLVRVCLRRRPTARPRSYPAHVWPLWYTAAGFRFAQHAGTALVLAALLEGV